MPRQVEVPLVSRCRGDLKLHSTAGEDFHRPLSLLHGLAKGAAAVAGQEVGLVPHLRSHDIHCCSLNRVNQALQSPPLFALPAQKSGYIESEHI